MITTLRTFLNSGRRTGRRGFTLIEMAIVVSIAGLLFVGLWRLISSGSGQLADQQASQQQQQLINSVKAYLASDEGREWLFNLIGGAGANSTHELPLPNNTILVGACPANQTTTNNPAVIAPATVPGCFSLDAWPNFLPPGFTAQTTNAFGQTYQILLRKITGALGAIGTYEFMIVTRGGQTIPDSRGGNLAALLGAEGGFVYSADTCGTPANQLACGAFGSFARDIVGFGNSTAGGGNLILAGGGRIVSISNSTAEAASAQPWLARMAVPGDTGQVLNTVSTTITFGAGAGLTFGAGAGLNGAAVTTGFTINGNGIAGSGTVLNIQAQDAANAINIVDGNIAAGSSNLNINTVNGQTYVYSSDARLKKDVAPIGSSLGQLSKLQGVKFHWIEGDKPALGFIAQEVEKVYPELVSTNAATGMKGVEYGNLVAPIVEAIKELHLENQKLRQELEQLKQAKQKE